MNHDEKDPKEIQPKENETLHAGDAEQQSPLSNKEQKQTEEIQFLQQQRDELKKEVEELKKGYALPYLSQPGRNTPEKKPFMNKKQTLFTVGVCLATALLTGSFVKTHDAMEQKSYEQQVEYHIFNTDDHSFYYHFEEGHDR